MFTTPNISPRSFSTYFAGFLLLLCATMATAHEEQDLCYPLAHGEDGMGSSNAKHLSHLVVSRTWYSQLYVTNVSRKSVNLKLQFTNSKGNNYKFPTASYLDEFNINNSPLSIETGGAILRPGETGFIILHSSNYPGTVTGKLTWQADACLDAAIIATIRNINTGDGGYTQGLFPLNNGEPF